MPERQIAPDFPVPCGYGRRWVMEAESSGWAVVVEG